MDVQRAIPFSPALGFSRVDASHYIAWSPREDNPSTYLTAIDDYDPTVSGLICKQYDVLDSKRVEIVSDSTLLTIRARLSQSAQQRSSLWDILIEIRHSFDQEHGFPFRYGA